MFVTIATKTSTGQPVPITLSNDRKRAEQTAQDFVPNQCIVVDIPDAALLDALECMAVVRSGNKFTVCVRAYAQSAHAQAVADLYSPDPDEQHRLDLERGE